MFGQAKTTDVYTDFSGLAELRNKAQNENPEALQAAARQFEALFLQMTIKTMRDAVNKSSLFNNSEQELYNGLFDQQLALHLSGASNIGIADLIYQRLAADQQPEQNKNLTDYVSESRYIGKAMEYTPGNENKWVSAESTSKINSLSIQREPWSNAREFIEHIKPSTTNAASQLNIAPEAILAVTALETGWGSHIIKKNAGGSSFNLFGIKASPGWHGESVLASTLEYANGAIQKRQELFRSYVSAEESINDFAKLIKVSPRYKNALNTAADPSSFFSALQQGGYATDPNYASKLDAVFHSNTIQRAFKK